MVEMAAAEITTLNVALTEGHPPAAAMVFVTI